jgi:hypothetical protein
MGLRNPLFADTLLSVCAPTAAFALASDPRSTWGVTMGASWPQQQERSRHTQAISRTAVVRFIATTARTAWLLYVFAECGLLLPELQAKPTSREGWECR